MRFCRLTTHLRCPGLGASSDGMRSASVIAQLNPSDVPRSRLDRLTAHARGDSDQRKRAWRSSRPSADGGGGGSRTRVRRRLTPSSTCLAHRWISSAGSTMCEARRATSLLDLTLGPAGGRRGRSRDNDPTSTSTGTSGFGAYALSGESVVVVVGNYKFAAGLTRKAAPSACTKLSHYPRRSQDTPGVVHPSTLHQMRAAVVISSGLVTVAPAGVRMRRA